IKQDVVPGDLSHLGILSVKEVLRRTNQESEGHRRRRHNEAHHQSHNLLGLRSLVFTGYMLATEHTQQCATEDARESYHTHNKRTHDHPEKDCV
ncbi:MAG: hypothetical protein WBG23_08975, partial [Acidobacteriaceae bacterium]